jgi:pyruvate/2-oxoglutarate dehydrogenase complex dihydrolipoamide dehydrogenase (E3) component
MHPSRRIVILGGGPAGVAAARTAARMGAHAILIESGRLGGVSTNTGVLPARVLAHAARLKRESGQLGVYGLCADEARLDWPAALQRLSNVVETLHARKEIAAEARKLGIEVHENVGKTRFVSPASVTFGGNILVEGDAAIICVGGHPRTIPLPGAELAISPDNIWRMKTLPRSIAIVGTGHTGCQFASILAHFGTEVHMLDRKQRIMAQEDELVSVVMAKEFAAHGIRILSGIDSVDGLSKGAGGGTVLHYKEAGETRSLETDAVLLCVGWIGNTDEIGLEALGVETPRSHIKVDKYLRTNIPSLYAAGDVTGGMMLVSGATHEGHVAAVNAVTNAETKKVAHELVPTGSFTDPEYGAIGMRERQCRDVGIDYETSVISCDDLTRAIIDDRTAGFCKLIADRKTHKFLGAHIVGERAVETVQLMATIIAGGLTVEQVADLELAFPTYSAIILMAARDLKYKLDPEYSAVYQSGMTGSPASKALS